MKKRKGTMDPLMIVVFFAIFFIIILVEYNVQLYTFRIIGTRTEDALALSNLASAVVDIEEYGSTHHLIITDAENAFNLYKSALKTNMGLDDSWNSIKNIF